jgi:hypothetical protein
MMRKFSGANSRWQVDAGRLRWKEVLVPPKNCHRDNVGRSLIERSHDHNCPALLCLGYNIAVQLDIQ